MATRKTASTLSPKAPAPAPEAPAPAAPAPEASAPAPEAPAPEPAAPIPAPKSALELHREIAMAIRNHPLGIDPRQISFSLNKTIQEVHTAIGALEAEGWVRRANLIGYQVVTLTPVGALEMGKL